VTDISAILGEKLRDAEAALNAEGRGKGCHLLARYGIDCAMLADRGSITDFIVVQQRPVWSPDPQGRERRGILTEIAEEMGVIALSRRVSERVIALDGKPHASAGCELIGWQSDIDRALLLWDWHIRQLERQLKAMPRPQGVTRGKFARDEAKLMASLAGAQVSQAESRARLMASAASAAGKDFPGIARVLRERKAAVEAAFEDAYPGLGKAPAPGRGSCTALAA
jgi:hypothetical protein